MSDKTTCLHDKHVALGAKMVSFGGFDMPLQYTDIQEEHLAVRKACGIFDVSHMGEIFVDGADAERFIQHVFTGDIAGTSYGKITYGMLLYENGGTVDDLLVYTFTPTHYLLVVNAANIEKDFAWLNGQTESFDVQLSNRSEDYGQIAVQGPSSEDVIARALELDGEDLTFYHFKTIETCGETLIVSRTGYTGEDGFEIYGSPLYIRNAWDALMADAAVKPCGLGARDTLRFEVGLPLYGDELSADITPLMAGLGIFVKWEKGDFIGRSALLQQKEEGLRQKIVGIELEDAAIPRHGYEVVDMEGTVVGSVTTGYKSIMTGRSVCMALVDTTVATLDTPLQVRIHRKLHGGKVVRKRFFDKHYKK